MKAPLAKVPSFALLLAAATFSSGCGVFVMQKDHDAMSARIAAQEAAVAGTRREVDGLKGEVQGALTRVDQALKMNADRGADFMTERQRLNGLAGKLDETGHALDELKKEVATTRAEQNARLDELKRSQEAQPTRPPPVTIPESAPLHYAAIAAAHDKKDFNVVRTLGREFVNRYPNDDKADDVLYLMGDADVREGRGASALGEFNRVLKFQPPSNAMAKTLLGMGDAYMLLKDCPNAKLAYQAAVTRFAKLEEGKVAKKKVDDLVKPAPGTCDSR